MRSWKHWLFHNWRLKLLSLFLATVFWVVVASEPTSEISMQIPLEYRNVPANSELVGDGADSVSIRLRGPSSLIRETTARDVSIAVDLAGMPEGSRIFPLTNRNIEAPSGIDVVRVAPSHVRVTLDRTMSKLVKIEPIIEGKPAAGFTIQSVSVQPEFLLIEGPASRVRRIERIPTTPIDLSGKQETFRQTADLGSTDPLVRIPKLEAVEVEVGIRAIRD